MLHEDKILGHWVLLVAHDLSVFPAGPDPSQVRATSTDRVGRPGELPRGELEALVRAGYLPLPRSEQLA